MKISPARKAAFQLLLRIDKEQAYSSVLLPQAETDLGELDRGLCHELVLGSLRRQIYLDRVINALANNRKLDSEVRIALRLALYQLYFLDKIPDHAAISESVDLVQFARKTSSKPFVNAILRKATRERPNLSFTDQLDRISVGTSHPRWLIEKWIKDHGADRTATLARANNETPPISFRVLHDSESVTSLIDSSKKSEYVDGCYTTVTNAALANEQAEGGYIYIQDEASQMVAQSVPIPEGGRFVDLCAAPGGKTGLIAKLNPTASIKACDLHESRVRFLEANCRRQDVDVEIFQCDATQVVPFEAASFDSVLVDAPCSGTGTIRRNPEIRYSLAPEDFEALQKKQLAILNNASKLIKTGGSLVYSTCSLEVEENETVASTFLSQNAEFALKRPSIPDRFFTDDGFARTWPDRDSMDGFFVAHFVRQSA
ncbi:MAG: 16S rRNA (cytosine(967)-C(5))-methyltransferase RsmB [Pyrinomonadaceae bacterium]